MKGEETVERLITPMMLTVRRLLGLVVDWLAALHHHPPSRLEVLRRLGIR